MPKRLTLIAALTPRQGIVVDVGCDHGHVAAAVGAIATERELRRLPRRAGLARVVADGLAAFRHLDVAILTGMGTNRILSILDAGPRPRVALVVHSPQHAHRLRPGLAERGWCIDAEALAPEAGRFAEVIRAVPGDEVHDGHLLAFGPTLHRDPLGRAHAEQLRGHWGRVASLAPLGSPPQLEAAGWVDWLTAHLEAARWAPD